METILEQFQKECKEEIALQGKDETLKQKSIEWYKHSGQYKYGYHFTWMGRPIIQLPQDMIAMQEIIWNVQPDVIVETGIAHGGSLIFYASLLELLHKGGYVIGIDIDIRPHNRAKIEKHPMYAHIQLIEGSSIAPETVKQVKQRIGQKKKVLVVLDSCHTHEHVLEELRQYSPLVTKGSYLICMDTIVQFVPDEFNGKRPWGGHNNPFTALQEFLKENERFEIDFEMDDKLLISESPHGFLRCVK